MNDNDLENQLRALTSALHRPDPTPAWKAEILSRALREASVTPLKRNLPPRWLMVGWAAAWTAIVAMNFLTPQDARSNDWVNRSKNPSPPMPTSSTKTSTGASAKTAKPRTARTSKKVSGPSSAAANSASTISTIGAMSSHAATNASSETGSPSIERRSFSFTK